MDYRYRMNRMDYRPGACMQPRQPEITPMPCPCQEENNIYHHADELPLTMAYVPMQTYGKTFESCKGLQSGTIFPELYKPFSGMRGNRC